MEVIAALNKVANYQDFVLITEKFNSPDSLDYSNVSLNISVLRDLRKVIEFERRVSIQDLGKNFIQSNIAAFVTNVILKSKVHGVWEDISAPIVSLIQFALNQYIELLNVEFSRWWYSLRIVISSLSELSLKHTSLQDLILSQLSEILLKLACIKSLPLNAVKHIIKNFNICSLNSKRQLRSKLCLSLQEYFSQIAQSIATCGDFDTQLAFFQTLLRWLVRRSDKEVRIAADRRWFSSSLFPHEARKIFVERKFENFDSDCRDFLNAVNQFSGLVTSIDAVSIQIGKIKLKELENKQICLDINSGCISIYCDATSFRNPQSKNCQYASQWETIIIMPEIVSKAQLKRESNEPVLSLYLEKEPEYQLPTSKMMILENYKTLDIQFNKSEDLKRVTTALRRLLGVKYTVQQNMKHLIDGPVQNKTSNVSECFIGTFQSASESTRCISVAQPHSDEDRSSTRRKYATKKYQKRSSSLSEKIARQHLSSEKKVSRILFKNSVRRELAPRGTSPSLASSTSTTSLALLGENLRRYQQVNFDKRMDYLAQSPSLSNITEETNVNALSVQSSYNNLLTKQNEITQAKSIKLPKCNKNNRSISPVVSSDDENFRSLLSLIVEQNSFNANTDINGQTQNFQDDLLKEAVTQKSVVLLTKLSNDDIEKISREITPTELHNKKTELDENQKCIRKQNEYQATSERENQTVYDSEEVGSDVILETQKQCNPVKSNVSEKVRLANPAKKLIKQADFAKNKSDDSSANDVIEATPLVNKSELLKQKKKVNDCKSEHIQKQFGDGTLNSHVIEKHVIDQFFDSHFSQVNETMQVNPDTARVNNETTSDSDTNEPVRLIESEVSKPSEPLANDIMQSIKECLANIIMRITEAEVKTYRDKKNQHSSSSQVNLTDRIYSNHKVEKIIETKSATNNDINKNITKFNDTKIPIITNKRRKLYSPGNHYQGEENSNNLISQNDDLMKVKPPDVYGGSASEDCRGKKTVRKKYLISESDEKYQRAKNEKYKARRTKLSKRPQKSAKTTSDHKLLASKLSNFIETDKYKDKEAVYELLSDSDEFEYKKKTKNMKKKQKPKNRRDENRKSTISTKHGRLVKACNYAESDTATSANDSSLTTSRDNSRDNSRSRFQKSLSLKHHNKVLSDEKMRKDSNSCPDTELNVMMDEVTIKNKMADDNDVIPKMLKNNISMEEQVNKEVIDNIFSKVTSPELNNVLYIENTEIENTIKVTPSKLHSNKSRISIERTKAKTKNLSKNKKKNEKDLNETSESLPPLIVEAVGNQRNDDKLDDITSLTIDKIKKALNRPTETTLDDLQSDVGAMVNENMCEVVDSDVLVESHGDILYEPIQTSEKVNKEKEENNLSMVKKMVAVENKDENEQVNINNNNVIEDNTIVNCDLPINAEIKTDSNIQTLTENIVRKDSVNKIQDIITFVDSSQSAKQIKSEKLIEQCNDIIVSIPTTVIYISDAETTPMNKVADVSLNTIGESPIRAHVDTTNDLPVTLEDLQRTLSPRQFSDRSIHVSPDKVLGNRTKRQINSRRFFSECSLWSDSCDSSEGDLRMYMNKKPRLSTQQNVNKRITLFCNTPENLQRHESTQLMENSSGLLFNLSALTAHISPIKCNFSRNNTKNQKTQNDIFNVQEEHQVIRKNKLATPPLTKEITLDNSTNDLLYKTTDCHISPIKLSPILHSDTDTSSASNSDFSPPINRKGKVMTLLDSDSERNVAADCSVANSKVNNLRGIQLSREDHEKSDTSDTDLSMQSEPRREPSLQPDLCRFDLKSRWKSLETQLGHISETDVQLEYRFATIEDCLRDVINLREQKKLQNAKLKEDIIEIRKLLSKVLDM